MTDTDNMISSSDKRKFDHDCGHLFTWDHSAVVVQAVAATAVYIDEHDNVVIRQQGAWNDEGDHLIVLPHHEAEKVAAAIFDATVALWPSKRQRQGEARAVTAPANVSRDPTAAARMRRHRERKRNSEPERNGGRNADRNTADDDPTARAEAAE